LRLRKWPLIRSRSCRGTTVGINERLDRYRISERCAEFTDEVLNFYADVLRNPLVEVERDGKSPLAPSLIPSDSTAR
jgi:hypothetical protein